MNLEKLIESESHKRYKRELRGQFNEIIKMMYIYFCKMICLKHHFFALKKMSETETADKTTHKTKTQFKIAN